MKKFCNFAVKNMAVFVVLAAVIGAVYPPSLTWIKPYVSIMLGIVMFGMGMTLTFADFRMVLKRPWEIFIGALAQFTIMPAMAWVGNIATDVLYPRADIIDAYRNEESSQSPPPSQRVSAGYLKNSSTPRVSGSVL